MFWCGLTNPSDRYFREPTVGFHIYKYSLSFRDTVQSMYSQLNPFILLIVLRPFRGALKDLLLQTMFKSNRRTLVRHKRRSKRAKCFNIVSEKLFTFRRLFSFELIGILVMSFLLGIITGVSISAPGFYKDHLEIQKHQGLSIRKDFEYKDLYQNPHEPVLSCGMNHGQLAFDYRRCFFVVYDAGDGLNFTQQLDACDKRGSVLTYPRDEKGCGFIWEFYIKSRGWHSQHKPQLNVTWFLHLGFSRVWPDLHPETFTSVDGRMNVSSETHFWFTDKWFSLRFRGPGVCITRTFNHPVSCLLRLRRNYSICSIDFSLNRSWT